MFEQIIGIIKETPPETGLYILFLCATIEYIFPPFPGDTISLLGAFLVGTGKYPLFSTFFAITAGSFAGTVAVYYLGFFLSRKYDFLKKHSNFFLKNKTFKQIEISFEKWGDLLIVINRFLPAVRSMFFLSAGLTRRSYLKVLILGFISLIIWNSIIMYAGILIGNNWNLLHKIFLTYSKWIVSVMIILTGVWILRKK